MTVGPGVQRDSPPAPDLQLNLTLCEPPFGTPLADQFDSALRMAAWADDHGFGAVRISEHHGAEDGYVPAPTQVGAAVAAVTRRIGIRFGVILLPLHHPLRVAEDLAVVDLLSRGRVMAIFGAGYRPQEYAMFGQDMRRRPSLMKDGIAAIRAAWSGEPFTHAGTTVRVTPRSSNGRARRSCSVAGRRQRPGARRGSLTASIPEPRRRCGSRTSTSCGDSARRRGHGRGPPPRRGRASSRTTPRRPGGA